MDEVPLRDTTIEILQLFRHLARTTDISWIRLPGNLTGNEQRHVFDNK